MNETANNLFVTASRVKLAIASPRGILGVDDLWDLRLEDLDATAILLNEALQKQARPSFIAPTKPNKATETTQLAFDIVKFVIDTRLAEKAAAAERANTEARRTFLRGLLEKKQLEQMESLTEDAIKAEIAALDPQPTASV